MNVDIILRMRKAILIYNNQISIHSLCDVYGFHMDWLPQGGSWNMNGQLICYKCTIENDKLMSYYINSK